MSPIAARRVPDQRPPAAADVEEAIARVQSQLAADVVEFSGLRLIESCARSIEVGAGVHHLRIQEEFVELVGAVVVETNVARGDAASGPTLREHPGIPAANSVEELAAKGGRGLRQLIANRGDEVPIHIDLAVDERERYGIGVGAGEPPLTAFVARNNFEIMRLSGRSGRGPAGTVFSPAN